MMRTMAIKVCMAGALALGLAACLPGQPKTGQETPTAAAPAADVPVDLDVPYVPTPEPVVDAMLKLAAPKSGEFIIDLGSGDGRIINTAVSRTPGLKGFGVDIDPQRIKEANEGAAALKITDRVEFRQEDLFKTDFSKANVMTMYLLPDINLQLREKIITTMTPGTRIVSHDFDMGEWGTEETFRVPGDESFVYFWIVPANAAGKWTLTPQGAKPVQIDINQFFQMLEGANAKGRVRGTEVTLMVAGKSYTGAISGDTITGQGFTATRSEKRAITLSAARPTAPTPQ
jgi:hypothetical protein